MPKHLPFENSFRTGSSQGRLPSPSSHTTGHAGSHPAVPMLMFYHQITRFRSDLKARAMQISWRVGMAFNPWTNPSTPGILSRNLSGPPCQGIPQNGLFYCSIRPRAWRAGVGAQHRVVRRLPGLYSSVVTFQNCISTPLTVSV